METNALQSRLEAGCLRFDLLRDNDNPNKFACYEVWSNADALKAHMDEPHTKAWGAFQYGDKKPVVSKSVFKATPVVEPQKPVDSEAELGVILQVEIKEEHVEEVLCGTPEISMNPMGAADLAGVR